MAKLNDKKKIVERIREIYVDYDVFENSVDFIINTMQKILNESKSLEYTNVYIKDISYCEESPDYEVWGTRLEIDKERDKRVEKALKRREADKIKRAKDKTLKDAVEFKEYERLQKKFGDKS